MTACVLVIVLAAGGRHQSFAVGYPHQGSCLVAAERLRRNKKAHVECLKSSSATASIICERHLYRRRQDHHWQPADDKVEGDFVVDETITLGNGTGDVVSAGVSSLLATVPLRYFPRRSAMTCDLGRLLRQFICSLFYHCWLN